jgi:signal transduction histidine kinase/FixJ family two-component response regulator
MDSGRGKLMAQTHILVVDDEPGITRLCERLLTRAKYRVTTFTDPAAAMTFVEKNNIDLLLVDIRMPEISGFDLIAHVKQHQPDTAVLVMTGYGTVDTAIQALREGVDGLLLKPFDTSKELVLTVKQTLDDNQKKRDIARIQALRPLFDVTETFLKETRPERLVEIVVRAICSHLHCNNAGFYQYSENDNSLNLLAVRGIMLPTVIRGTEGGLIGHTDALGEPDWVNASGPGNAHQQAALVSLGLGSAFIAPISRLNVHGVIYAGKDAGEAAFREVDWEMFLLMVRQAAVAMENARLYEELRGYIKRMEDSQQALIRAEKMAAAGRLTASIAHEINNPLQAVQNCLHLATREELTAKKQRGYIDLAKHELDRLMRTVQRMLDFYRPGSVDPQRVNLVILLRRVIKLLSPQLQGRNIRISTRFSSKLPAILAVGSQLEQVFINLFLNAYDAMPEGGELRISARRAGDMVEIFVQDTGPGVSEENRSRIFEPFVSTKEGGTGLGLTVSYGIIAAHGGSLDLISDHSPGARFRVTIPIKDEA